MVKDNAVFAYSLPREGGDKLQGDRLALAGDGKDEVDVGMDELGYAG